MMDFTINAPVQKIVDPEIENYGINLYLKREDLIHPTISGNKWRKLKYNLKEAQKQSLNLLLTFGGAFSNHIAATAWAGRQYGFKTIGVIRGEEYSSLNPTLELARKCGMKLIYISRKEFRTKKFNSVYLKELKSTFGDFYFIPEGGANIQGIKGCLEIVSDIKIDYNYLCCSCGTGSTLAGLILGNKNKGKVIGFSSLKGSGFIEKEIKKFICDFENNELFKKSWEITYEYHFGGYAKTKPELFKFVKAFEQRNNIPLDFVYTGKMVFGIFDLIKKDFFKRGETIIAIHTGGLQGNKGMVINN